MPTTKRSSKPLELTPNSIKQAFTADKRSKYANVTRKLRRRGAATLLPLLHLELLCSAKRDSKSYSDISPIVSDTIDKIARRFPDDLVLLLNNNDHRIQAKAAQYIGGLRLSQGLTPLMSVVEAHTSPSVVSSAMLALGELGDISAETVIARHLNSTESMLRKSAIKALREIKSPLLASHIRKLIDDPSQEVSGEAIFAAGYVDAYEVIPDLIKIVDKEKYHIAPAMLSLGKLKATGSIDIIRKYHDHPWPTMRYLVASSLGEMASIEALPILITLSNDIDTRVRCTTCEAFGNIGGKDAKAELKRMLSDTDQEVVKAARAALSQIRRSERAT